MAGNSTTYLAEKILCFCVCVAMLSVIVVTLHSAQYSAGWDSTEIVVISHFAGEHSAVRRKQEMFFHSCSKRMGHYKTHVPKLYVNLTLD